MGLSNTGDCIALVQEKDSPIRDYAAEKCGPAFACGANNKLPCARTGAKAVMGSFDYRSDLCLSNTGQLDRFRRKETAESVGHAASVTGTTVIKLSPSLRMH